MAAFDFTKKLLREELIIEVRKLFDDEPLARLFYHCPIVNKSDSTTESIRIMQWNLLAQALCSADDSFTRCPPSALDWESRKWKVLHEILIHDAHIVCLQEIDHFDFIKDALSSVGYVGTFEPKPDSPCLYVEGNNGPDGCAIFYKSEKVNLIERYALKLSPEHPVANQVALFYKLALKDRPTYQEFVVSCTHLKAKNGYNDLRLLEGQHIVKFALENFAGLPLVICGDFNGPPSEDVYNFLINSELNLDSAYRKLTDDGSEPPYTTWKIRGYGNLECESCKTIDYIFYSKKGLIIKSLLNIPSGEEIGENRLPSVHYPSDHFSLVTDIAFTSDSNN